MTQQPNPADMQAMIAESVSEALRAAGLDIPASGLQPQQVLPQAAPAEEVTMKEFLEENVDPRDTESAIAMLDWLLHSGRLKRIGVLDGAQGYLYIYEEPKGSSHEGYRPGATQGDRIVDSAVEHLQESGAAKVKSGLCPHCMSAVQDDGSGIPVLADDEAEDRDKCSANGGGPHGFIS